MVTPLPNYTPWGVMSLLNFLKNHLIDGFLPLHVSVEAAEHYGCTLREIEELALGEGILPLRYKRNQHTLSTSEQYTLFQSHVLILGCGGLGGFIAELLCRIGVGTLTLMDGDVFEEHNLNRQNFSTIETLGEPKASVLKKALEKINPALHVKAYETFFDLPKHEALLQKADVVVDALDNPDLKCLLASWCHTHQKNFVHGAIAGYYAQFASNQSLEHLYPHKGVGAENLSGNLSFTACFAASIQSAEVIKLLLHKPHLETALFADLWEYGFNPL
jgi:molybdopterin-synthase adenylyltransferase